MKREPWFRMYTSILRPTDKTRALPDKLYRQWTYILALYKDSCAVMPDMGAIALALGVTPSAAEKVTLTLRQAGLLELHDGALVPHDWDDLQFESDTSRERMRRYRERLKRLLCDVVSDARRDGEVTSPVTESLSVRNRDSEIQSSEKQSGASSVGVLPVVEPAKNGPEPTPEPKHGPTWNGKIKVARAMLAAWPVYFRVHWPDPDDATCARMLDAFGGDTSALLVWLQLKTRHRREPGDGWGLLVTMAQDMRRTEARSGK